MGEVDIEEEIFKLVNRLEILDDTIIDLIETDDGTILESSWSQINDFKNSLEDYMYILDETDYGDDYGWDIYRESKKFIKPLKHDTLFEVDLMQVINILRFCKDNINKIIVLLKPNETSLFSQLRACRGKMTHLKKENDLLIRTNKNYEQQIKELTGETVESNTTREFAEQSFDKHFTEPMRRQKKVNIIKIIIVLKENNKGKLNTGEIQSETDIKSKETVRKICNQLNEKNLIEKDKKAGSDYWTLKNG